MKTSSSIAELKALEVASNPLLERLNKMPGETIRLPSRGKFYDERVLVEAPEGEILLRPLTLTDEVFMKSPDMLMQGTAIDYTFKRCSPNIVSPLDLVMPDVNYILTHLRRISLGSELTLHFQCSNDKCNHKQEVDVPLDYFTQTSKELEDSEIDSIYTYVTGNGQIVKLRPVNLRDFLKMSQDFRLELMEDTEAYAQYLRNTFMAIIQSVDDIDDRKIINEWLDHLPIKEVKAISKKIAQVQGLGPKFEFTAKCSKCKHSNDLSTEINPTSFFIEPSDLETETE